MLHSEKYVGKCQTPKCPRIDQQRRADKISAFRGYCGQVLKSCGSKDERQVHRDMVLARYFTTSGHRRQVVSGTVGPTKTNKKIQQNRKKRRKGYMGYKKCIAR